MQVLGRAMMTTFAGRASLSLLSVLVLAIQPIALMVLLLVSELAGVIAFIVLFGAAKGCLTGTPWVLPRICTAPPTLRASRVCSPSP